MEYTFEERIVVGSVNYSNRRIKEIEPDAFSYAALDVPAITFKISPRNYLNLQLDGKKFLCCDDYMTDDRKDYNEEAIIRTLGDHLAMNRVREYYKFRN